MLKGRDTSRQYSQYSLLALALVSVFLFQSLFANHIKSTTSDEPVHLAAGLSYLETGIFRANPEQPPLLKELSALARARSAEMNYGSGGVGTTPHLSGELLATMARLKLVHIPYKGEGPAIIDVLAGHLPFMFSNVTASNMHVQAGKMRALAVTGRQRTPVVPGVPTLAESGLPGFEVVGFFGVIAAAGTPREIVTQLNTEIGKVIARPDIRERFTSQALDPANQTAEQFGEYIKSEAGKWGKLIREAGITEK